MNSITKNIAVVAPLSQEGGATIVSEGLKYILLVVLRRFATILSM